MAPAPRLADVSDHLFEVDVDTAVPNLCLKCGAPGRTTSLRTVHGPRTNWFGGRAAVKIPVTLCRAHADRRRNAAIAETVLSVIAVAALGLFLIPAVPGPVRVAVAAWVAASTVVCVLLDLLRRRGPKVARVESGRVWLAGVPMNVRAASQVRRRLSGSVPGGQSAA